MSKDDGVEIAMGQEPQVESAGTTRSSTFVFLLGAAAATVAVAGLKEIPYIGAMLLSLVLVLMAWPVARWLRSKGAPTAVAFTGLVIAVFGILWALVGSTVWASVQLVNYLATNDYSETIAKYQTQIFDLIKRLGIEEQAIQKQVIKTIEGLDFAALGSRALGAVSGVMNGVTVISIVIIAVFFMAMDAIGFVDRLEDSVAVERPGVRDALLGFSKQTRSYFLVATVFGLIVAAVDVLALWALGIPLAMTWGVLSFITNYIPNIGFIMGMIPPTLVALLEKGAWQALWVMVIYFVINTVIQTLIQPKFVGDSLGLSATLSFFSLLFWAYVVGPIGTLIAVPMTLLVKALLVDTDPNVHWVRPLVSLSESDSAANRRSAAKTTSNDPKNVDKV